MTDAWDSLISRHGLTFGEAVRVRDEIGLGREFTEPHVRAAAAEWARHRLDTEGIASLWASRWRRVFLVAALVVFVGDVVWRRSTTPAHGWYGGPWVGLGLMALNLLGYWNGRRLLRETVRRNEASPDQRIPDRRSDHLL